MIASIPVSEKDSEEFRSSSSQGSQNASFSNMEVAEISQKNSDPAI